MNKIESEFLLLEKEKAEFPLDLQLVQAQGQTELNVVNSPLKKLINDEKS